MKVLQLIDSLEAGGAERVAVNYANGLVNYLDGSYLCATRAEGVLKFGLSNTAGYLFLNKKSTIDIKAIKFLNEFIRKNKIDIIHAHSSSFFLGTIIKILNPKLKLIWHDHYGNRVNDSFNHIFILKICSLFFSSVLVVSNDLKIWANKKLIVNRVTYVQNYPQQNLGEEATLLKGEKEKRIVCLANLRPDKNHGFLIKTFNEIRNLYPDWTLHLVGKDNYDEYSVSLKELIKKLELTKNVFLYGSCPDISNILSQVQIGVLSSKSEGLPLALLEYGLAGLTVVTTDVGDCSKVIKNESLGILVKSENEKQLYSGLLSVIGNREDAILMGKALKNHIEKNFSEEKNIQRVVAIYKDALKNK
ncbi:glycosyltransferase [Algibacter sp. L4_22]|uniref:glycosyltransferase n=1 Tax=Algibacter sp. L4_22 TaxID=2942477 RepID=UPI00201B977E|nr:glycosyltransferase [Algibacter sp. L4_22]MCL5128729.1 glycosyltransferase [Algibacter sp. L4_22]